MMSFEEILRKPTAEIKAPVPLPVGTYHCLVEGPPEQGKSSQKQTNYLRFKYRILAAQEDVDARAAAEQQVVGKSLTQDFYITDNEFTHHMLKEYLEEALAIENPEGKKSILEMLAEVPGRQCLVKIKHEISNDGKRVFSRVDSAARV